MNKYKYKNMVFFDADAGGGDGGAGGGVDTGGGTMSRGAAAFDSAPRTGADDRPLPEPKGGSGPSGAGTGKGGAGEATPPATTTPPAGFDPVKFAETFAGTLGESLKPIIAPKKEMTPEEARKLLKVWEPGDDWYTRFDNLETRKDAITEMRDALTEQANTRATLQLQEALEQLRGEYAPHIQAFQAAEERAREARFAGAYPQLGKPELQPLIKSVVDSLVTEKATFKTENELFTAIAKRVEAVFKVSNPEFKLETATNGSGQQTEDRGGRRLPVSTPGGGGGTGRQASGDGPPVKKGLAVFAKS